MNYETIDPILSNWAARHALQLHTRYHETEVRTVFFEGTNSERAQIWIDPPHPGGKITVHAAVYRRRGRDNQSIELSADLSNLAIVLDEAFDTVSGWLEST